jgi:hypothetical protein
MDPMVQTSEPPDWGPLFDPFLGVGIGVGKGCAHVCNHVSTSVDVRGNMPLVPGLYLAGSSWLQTLIHLLTRPSRGWSFRGPHPGWVPTVRTPDWGPRSRPGTPRSMVSVGFIGVPPMNDPQIHDPEDPILGRYPQIGPF